MKIWNRVRDAWPVWRWGRDKAAPTDLNSPDGDPHLERTRDSLRALLEDPHVPNSVREALGEEFGQVQAMLDKLEYGHIHIAVFGRVGVGKSALLNALLGEQRFSSSPLHGETREAGMAPWQSVDVGGGVFLIDTPGINEVEGEARERLAHDVAGRADLVLFVVEGDLSQGELEALRRLCAEQRPLLLVFNKVDRYNRHERQLVLEALNERTIGLLPAGRIVVASAEPAEREVLLVDEQGRETEAVRRPPRQVEDLRERLWTILEAEGKTLAAVNAGLFAGRISDALAHRVLLVKKELADRLLRNYCIAKGVVVGFNPIPVADLVAAVAVDASLVVHLSRVLGLPMGRREAGALVRTIGAQMALVMGTVWAVNFISSALKAGSGGLSTVLTAATQGAVAYYATYVVGQAARRYLEQGKSWGEQGPKRVVADILASVDRDSLLAQAREELLLRLRRSPQ